MEVDLPVAPSVAAFARAAVFPSSTLATSLRLPSSDGIDAMVNGLLDLSERVYTGPFANEA